MPVIRWTSKTSVPYQDTAKYCPRYEIGDFFVTVYFILRKETASARKLQLLVESCLADKSRYMRRNDGHPSSSELSAGSGHPGTHVEMHEGAHGDVVKDEHGQPTALAAHNHMHLELIKKQRDTPFSDDELKTIKRVLKDFVW